MINSIFYSSALFCSQNKSPKTANFSNFELNLNPTFNYKLWRVLRKSNHPHATSLTLASNVLPSPYPFRLSYSTPQPWKWPWITRKNWYLAYAPLVSALELPYHSCETKSNPLTARGVGMRSNPVASGKATWLPLGDASCVDFRYTTGFECMTLWAITESNFVWKEWYGSSKALTSDIYAGYQFLQVGPFGHFHGCGVEQDSLNGYSACRWWELRRTGCICGSGSGQVQKLEKVSRGFGGAVLGAEYERLKQLI